MKIKANVNTMLNGVLLTKGRTYLNIKKTDEAVEMSKTIVAYTSEPMIKILHWQTAAVKVKEENKGFSPYQKQALKLLKEQDLFTDDSEKEVKAMKLPDLKVFIESLKSN